MTLQQLAELVRMAETHCSPDDTVQLDADDDVLYVTDTIGDSHNVTAIMPGYRMRRVASR